MRTDKVDNYIVFFPHDFGDWMCEMRELVPLIEKYCKLQGHLRHQLNTILYQYCDKSLLAEL